MVEYKFIPGKDTIQIKNPKIETLENVSALNVTWKGYSGYVPLNKILAPSFIASLSRVFSNRPTETNNHIRDLNEKIKKIITDFNLIRAQNNLGKQEIIDIIINKEKIPGVSYAVSQKIDKDSNIHTIFLNNKNKGQIFIGQPIDLEDNISYFMNETNSFIFQHKVFINFINNITAGAYLGKELKLSCAMKLKHSNTDHTDFFTSSVFGRNGSFTGGGEQNATHLTSSDIDIIPRSIKTNIAYLKSSDEIISKTDIKALFNSDKFHLVAAVTFGSQMYIRGKLVQNIALGIYHEDFLKSLRNYVEIK